VEFEEIIDRLLCIFNFGADHPESLKEAVNLMLPDPRHNQVTGE
jgi:hypothetical protein